MRVLRSRRGYREGDCAVLDMAWRVRERPLVAPTVAGISESCLSVNLAPAMELAGVNRLRLRGGSVAAMMLASAVRRVAEAGESFWRAREGRAAEDCRGVLGLGTMLAGR